MVRLTRSQQFSYYMLPLALALWGLIPGIMLVTGNTSRHFPSVAALLCTCAFLGLSGWAFFLKRKKLSFHVFPSRLDIKTKNRIAREILREYGWDYGVNIHNFIQAEGYGFRKGVDWRTWSDLMTIVIEKDQVKINSINNPGSMFPQAFSFGKNKQNIRNFELLFLGKEESYINEQTLLFSN